MSHSLSWFTSLFWWTERKHDRKNIFFCTFNKNVFFFPTHLLKWIVGVQNSRLKRVFFLNFEGIFLLLSSCTVVKSEALYVICFVSLEFCRVFFLFPELCNFTMMSDPLIYLSAFMRLSQFEK